MVLTSVLAVITFIPWAILDFMVVMFLVDRTDHSAILSLPVTAIYEGFSLSISIILISNPSSWTSPNSLISFFVGGRVIVCLIVICFEVFSICCIASDHYYVQEWVAVHIKGDKNYRLSFVDCSKDVLWMCQEYFFGRDDSFCPYCGRRYSDSNMAQNCCSEKAAIGAPQLFKNEKVHSWERTRIVPIRKLDRGTELPLLTCPRCKGSGYEPTMAKHFCYRCDGMGKVRF